MILFIISFTSASCEEGQIDINGASLGELDEIIYIGVARAKELITLRPFASVDELIKIGGIGDVYLSKIKEQGMACVGGEEIEQVEELDEIIEEPLIDVEESEGNSGEEKENQEPEMITLTTQTIKSPENIENKSNYALYGFVGFCFLLGVLFLLRKRKYKNEFR